MFLSPFTEFFQLEFELMGLSEGVQEDDGDGAVWGAAFTNAKFTSYANLLPGKHCKSIAVCKKCFISYFCFVSRK